MLVGFYTVRIVLEALGAENYGIYNVVGGIVIVFSFLSGSMASTTQRFLAAELGRGNYCRLKMVFGTVGMVHLGLAVIVFLLGESIGLWFLNTHLIIPPDRLPAANWVYQCAIGSCCISVVCVPFLGAVIAREEMNVFAYISILEVVMKLWVAILLQYSEGDKLKLYAVLMLILTLVMQLFYCGYCRRHFPESRYWLIWSKPLLRKIIVYSGWNLFGTLAAMIRSQGLNILLNVFFDPVVNAARGIAYQINSAVNGFVANFQVALTPQITKSYVAGDSSYLYRLVFLGSKYSFFLLFFLSLPILLEADFLLNIWLKEVPEYTVIFCRLTLIVTLIDSLSGPLIHAALATASIGKYQGIVGGIIILVLPISYIMLWLGYPPTATMYVCILFSFIALATRLLLLRVLIGLSLLAFSREVLLRIAVVPAAVLPLPLFLQYVQQPGPLRFMSVSACCTGLTVTAGYWLGFSNGERLFVRDTIHSICRRRWRHE